MADYYVETAANGGSDSNDGSEGSPFLTIGKANTVVSPDDNVYIGFLNNGGTFSITDNSWPFTKAVNYYGATLLNRRPQTVVDWGGSEINASNAVGSVDFSGGNQTINRLELANMNTTDETDSGSTLAYIQYRAMSSASVVFNDCYWNNWLLHSTTAGYRYGSMFSMTASAVNFPVEFNRNLFRNINISNSASSQACAMFGILDNYSYTNSYWQFNDCIIDLTDYTGNNNIQTIYHKFSGGGGTFDTGIISKRSIWFNDNGTTINLTVAPGSQVFSLNDFTDATNTWFENFDFSNVDPTPTQNQLTGNPLVVDPTNGLYELSYDTPVKNKGAQT